MHNISNNTKNNNMKNRHLLIFIIFFFITSILSIYSSTFLLNKAYSNIYIKQIIWYIISFVLIYIIYKKKRGFFFKYDTLIRHPKAVEEGVLPLKIKDEVVLKDWIHAIVIPEVCRDQTIEHIPDTLSGKVHYIKNDTRDIWEWSEKVYEYAKQLPESR